MAFFLQMADDQLLIGHLQHIRGADRVENQSAAGRQRLQQQMDFRVMPQRLKMTHALHGVFDGFLIEYPGVFQCHIQVKPLLHQSAEHLLLHPAHDLHMDSAALREDVQLRIFLFQ